VNMKSFFSLLVLACLVVFQACTNEEQAAREVANKFFQGVQYGDEAKVLAEVNMEIDDIDDHVERLLEWYDDEVVGRRYRLTEVQIDEDYATVYFNVDTIENPQPLVLRMTNEGWKVNLKYREFVKQVKAVEEKNRAETMATKQEFNTEDISVASNGNLAVAFEIIKSMKAEGTKLSDPESNSVYEISTKPFNYLGKVVQLRGEVYRKEQLSPEKYAITMLSKNNNAPLGTTNVVVVLADDPANVRIDSYVTVTGYYVGQTSSNNLQGGSLTIETVVGHL